MPFSGGGGCHDTTATGAYLETELRSICYILKAIGAEGLLSILERPREVQGKSSAVSLEPRAHGRRSNSTQDPECNGKSGTLSVGAQPSSV